MRMERERERERSEREAKRGERASTTTTARSSTTGLGPRGMRVRHCPSGSVSLNPTARGPLTTSTSADVYGEAEPLGSFFIGAL